MFKVLKVGMMNVIDNVYIRMYVFMNDYMLLLLYYYLIYELNSY